MLGGAGIGLLNASMLWGLAAVAVPLLLHLWRRRREVVDWGAMIFLDDAPGEPTRRAIRIDDRLQLAVRMALLTLLVLALARPFWTDMAGAPASEAASRQPRARGRTFVLAIDGSASMGDRIDGITPRALALRWARRVVSAMDRDDSAALVDAGARCRTWLGPPTRDKTALARSLADMETAGGGGGPSDLPAALDEAFRILADAPDGPSDVILLTDGRRIPWRTDEPLRWELTRELHRRLGVYTPRIWAVSFGESTTGQAHEHSAAIGPLNLGRSPILAGRPIVASAVVENTGTRPITPLGQLVVDGRPQGPPAEVGPISSAGRATLSFTTQIASPGIHLVSIKLLDDDSTPGDDESEGLIEVTERLPVLIVDGKPSPEPLGGQADFLRIALDPRDSNKAEPDLLGARTSAFRVRMIPVGRFQLGHLVDAKDVPRVLVLADVAELSDEMATAVERFTSAGGGLIVAVGDEARSPFFSAREWFPGRLDESISTVSTRLDPASFSGSTLGHFAAAGAASGAMATPLAQVEVFRHRIVEPGPRAVVTAKLASGDAWCVERPFGKGRVMVVTTALDGRATTLPINPDFVPLAHEWILSLARGSSTAGTKSLQPGEPWVVPLDPPPPADVKALPLRVPGGKVRPVAVARYVDGGSVQAQVRIDDTDAPGVYRLGLDRPLYASVDRDAGESDPTPLSDEERDRLSRDWPFVFASGDLGIIERIRLQRPSIGQSPESSRFEFWRFLVLAALVGLVVESWLTRRLSRSC